MLNTVILSGWLVAKSLYMSRVVSNIYEIQFEIRNDFVPAWQFRCQEFLVCIFIIILSRTYFIIVKRPIMWICIVCCTKKDSSLHDLYMITLDGRYYKRALIINLVQKSLKWNCTDLHYLWWRLIGPWKLLILIGVQ